MISSRVNKETHIVFWMSQAHILISASVLHSEGKSGVFDIPVI